MKKRISRAHKSPRTRPADQQHERQRADVALPDVLRGEEIRARASAKLGGPQKSAIGPAAP